MSARLRVEFVDWLVVREPQSEDDAWRQAVRALCDDRDELALERVGFAALDEASFKVYRVIRG